MVTSNFSLVHPLCLGGFINYFGQTEDDVVITFGDAYWYASGMVLSFLFVVVTFSPFVLYLIDVSGTIRIGLSGLIYRKILRMSTSSLDGGQIGRIINLLSNDLRRLDEGLLRVFNLWKAPLEAVAFFCAIYMEIGVAAVIGMGFLLSFIPLKSEAFNNNKKLFISFKLKRT